MLVPTTRHAHLALTLVLGFLCGGTLALAQPGSRIEKSGPWERILHGEYLVENCTWNVSAAKSGWRETIFCDTASGSLGWRWDFSGDRGEKASVVKSFPEVIFGRKPYDGYASTTPRLPTVLDSAGFTIEYDYQAHADGVYNTSTDISFTDTRRPGPGNIRAKMMIWFDRRKMPFFDENSSRLAVIGGRVTQVFIDRDHVGPEGKWVMIGFLPRKLPLRGSLPLRPYIDFALSAGALRPDLFLSSIEIGSEIASGKGEVTFRRFNIR